MYRPLIFSAFIMLVVADKAAFAQNNERVVQDQCGTMIRLQARLQRRPELRAGFDQRLDEFNKMMNDKTGPAEKDQLSKTPVLVPVVFHIVMTNPSLVTDAQIQAQLDTLNKDFFGTNGDSVRIPSYFKSYFGKSSIQFCLAQRTPDGEVSSGIDRVVTTSTSFTVDDGVKHASTGGVAGWDSDKYLNIWICNLSGGYLGYATFPDDGYPDEQGVVIDYRTLPGGSYSNYNGGKTLTHETGHYFNLYHIWGDDGTACTGTDYVNDTPNQAGSTSGCYSGLRTDNCTTSGNGIMYQNYMDYSNDACLVMFTTEQVNRMENALAVYRPSLLNSDGCEAVVLKDYNVQLKSVDQPGSLICTPSFTPAITIRNRGLITLTSLRISVMLDEGNATVYNWTGSLASEETTSITLNILTASAGDHLLTIYTSYPNEQLDQETGNDTLQLNFQYNLPVTEISESFEAATFPPAGWSITNADGGITWSKTTDAAKTGLGSVMINNYDYTTIGQKDDLRLPPIALASSLDTAFFSFQIAAAAYTATSTSGNVWDTLEVLASTDCGQSFTSLYKKWGSSLVTRAAATTSAFVPVSSEWRKDSIDLSAYIGSANLLLAFRNTTGYENNIYLDDINLRTVTVNPNLKSQGFLVAPNPTQGALSVQFYPQPANLRSIQVFTATGMKLIEQAVGTGQASNIYWFDLSGYAAGVYIVRAVFADKVIVRKVIKL